MFCDLGFVGEGLAVGFLEGEGGCLEFEVVE